MKIVIDARWIFPEISGIGAYTRELARHLALLDTKNDYLLLFCDERIRDRTVQETGLDKAANFSTRLLPYGVFSLRSQLLLPGLLKAQGADIYHSTNYMVPFLAFSRRGPHATRCVATVHDVIPMLFPHAASRSRKSRMYPLFRRLMIELGIRADAIVTDSNASKDDILKCLKIPGERSCKVHASYCGVAPRFRPATAGGRAPGETNRPRTILYVGRMDPYKNLATAIRALVEIRRKCSFPVSLTVAGSDDPRYPEARRLAADLGLGDAVRWTGYLSDSDLVVLYQQSDVLIHPSLYEGFGLQVVEAMACGLPVVCSNGGSLPEVAGDAAIVLDPNDTAGFAEKVTEVLTRPDLARSMSEKGTRQASKFTWEACAKSTLAVYEKILQGS